MDTSNRNYTKCCENNLPIACLLWKMKYVNLSLFTLCLVIELSAPLGGPRVMTRYQPTLMAYKCTYLTYLVNE